MPAGKNLRPDVHALRRGVTSDGLLQLSRQDVQLQQAPLPATQDGWRELEFEFRSNLMRAWVNGAVVAETRIDASPTEGGCSLTAWSMLAEFEQPVFVRDDSILKQPAPNPVGESP